MWKIAQRLIATAIALGAISLADALTVFNYSPGTNERFSSGFPSSPVTNSSFFLASYNLSGIGWTSGSFGMTLISPQHFLTAAHVAPANGTTISFLNTDGTVKSYTVDSTFVIQHSAGVDTDLVVGRLTAPIAAIDHVTYYPTVLLNSVSDYVGATVAVFGSGQRAGVNTIDDAGTVDMLPFGPGDTVADNVVFVTDYDSVTGQTQGQSGDSGSPSFIGIGGSLALVGTHSAIDSNSPPETFDVLVPAYYSKINDRLALDGYSFGAFVAIPEPGTWSLLAGVAIFAAVRLRRRNLRA